MEGLSFNKFVYQIQRYKPIISLSLNAAKNHPKPMMFMWRFKYEPVFSKTVTDSDKSIRNDSIAFFPKVNFKQKVSPEETNLTK